MNEDFLNSEWLASRPQCVKDLVAEFPIETMVELGGVLHGILGYTEDDMLILTPVDPTVDYDLAVKSQILLCADHLRGLTPVPMTTIPTEPDQ